MSMKKVLYSRGLIINFKMSTVAFYGRNKFYGHLSGAKIKSYNSNF